MVSDLLVPFAVFMLSDTTVLFPAEVIVAQPVATVFASL